MANAFTVPWMKPPVQQPGMGWNLPSTSPVGDPWNMKGGGSPDLGPGMTTGPVGAPPGWNTPSGGNVSPDGMATTNSMFGGPMDFQPTGGPGSRPWESYTPPPVFGLAQKNSKFGGYDDLASTGPIDPHDIKTTSPVPDVPFLVDTQATTNAMGGGMNPGADQAMTNGGVFGGGPTGPGQSAIPGAPMPAGAYSGAFGRDTWGGPQSGLAMPSNFLGDPSTWGQNFGMDTGAWSNPGGQAAFGAGPSQQMPGQNTPSGGNVLYDNGVPTATTNNAPWQLFGQGSNQMVTTNGGSMFPGVASDPTGGGSLDANPYMRPQIDYLTDLMGRERDKGLQRIKGNSIGTSGLGGSRQGVAEGELLAQHGRDVGGAVSNLLSGNYQFDRGLNTNSYNTNRQLDIQDRSSQAQIADLMNRGQLNTILSMYGLGQQSQNDAWNPLRNASSIYGPYTGLNSSVNTGGQGGGWQGALGGGISGLALARQMGWI